MRVTPQSVKRHASRLYEQEQVLRALLLGSQAERTQRELEASISMREAEYERLQVVCAMRAAVGKEQDAR